MLALGLLIGSTCAVLSCTSTPKDNKIISESEVMNIVSGYNELSDKSSFSSKTLMINNKDMNIVNSNNIEYSNAIKTKNNTILQFKTEEECEYTYELLSKVIDVNIDNVVSIATDTKSEDEEEVKLNTTEQDKEEEEADYYIPEYTIENVSDIVDKKYNENNRNIEVAVLDTGYSGANNNDRVIDYELNYSTTGKDTGIYDDCGHGTFIGTNILNNTCENVSIVPIKIADKSGLATSIQLYEGIEKAIELNVEIINISMCAIDTISDSSIINEAINDAYNNGIFVVVASGNKGDDVSRYVPANSKNAITVSAVNTDKNLMEFSNTGDKVDFCSYGETGTSVAASNVSAYIANVYSINKEYNYRQTYDKVISEAKDLGEKGKDSLYGYGLLSKENYVDSEQILMKQVKTAIGSEEFNNKDMLETAWWAKLTSSYVDHECCYTLSISQVSGISYTKACAIVTYLNCSFGRLRFLWDYYPESGNLNNATYTEHYSDYGYVSKVNDHSGYVNLTGLLNKAPEPSVSITNIQSSNNRKVISVNAKSSSVNYIVGFEAPDARDKYGDKVDPSKMFGVPKTLCDNVSQCKSWVNDNSSNYNDDSIAWDAVYTGETDNIYNDVSFNINVSPSRTKIYLHVAIKTVSGKVATNVIKLDWTEDELNSIVGGLYTASVDLNGGSYLKQNGILSSSNFSFEYTGDRVYLAVSSGYEDRGEDITDELNIFNAMYYISKPVRSGYKFTGWYIGDTKLSRYDINNGTYLMYCIENPKKDVNIQAHWERTEYNIDVKLNGGQYYNTDNNISTDDYSFTYNVNDMYVGISGTSEYEGTLINNYNTIKNTYYISKPTKSGYDFIGWYIQGTDTKFVTNKVFGIYTIDNPKCDIVVEARYAEVRTVTIHIDANGGNFDSKDGYLSRYDKKINLNDYMDKDNVIIGTGAMDIITYDSVTTPERDGYVFKGWSVTDSNEIEVLKNIKGFYYLNKVPNRDITIKATWGEKNTYNIHIDAGDGQFIIPGNEYASSYDKTWDWGQSDDVNISTNYMYWTRSQDNLNCVSGVLNSRDFMDWVTIKGGNNLYYDSWGYTVMIQNKPCDTVIVAAYFSKSILVVNWDSGISSVTGADTTYTNNTNATITANMKEGYQFKYYEDISTGEKFYNQTSDVYMGTSDRELRAVSEPASYKMNVAYDSGVTGITYDKGASIANNEVKYTYGATATVKANVDSAHMFDYVEDLDTGSKYYDNPSTWNMTSNKNIKVHTKLKDKIALNSNGGTFYVPNIKDAVTTYAKYYVNTPVKISTNNEESADGVYSLVSLPKRAGYTFINWTTSDKSSYTEKDSSGYQVLNNCGTGDITLYAQWKANDDTQYIVRHWKQNLNSDSSKHDSFNYSIAEMKALKGTTDTKVTPKVNTYDGFTSPTSLTINIDGNGNASVDYYYTRNSYNVRLSSGVGIESVTGSKEYEYQSDVSISAKVKVGYTWTGWTGTLNIDSASHAFSMPAYDINLVANATPNTDTKYTVRHWKQKLDGNADIHDNTNYSLADTDSLKGTTDTTVDTYTKDYGSGWHVPTSQTVTIKGDGSAVVNYYYTRKSYDVTIEHYVMNTDGSYSDKPTKTVAYGKHLYEQSLTNVNLKDSSLEIENGIQYDSEKSGTETIIEDNTVIKLYYRRFTYTVTFDASTNGGKFSDNTTNNKVDTYYYGANVNLNKYIANKDTFEFVGWNESSSATSRQTNIVINTSNIKLYAIYSKLITLNFVDKGGSRSLSETVYNNTSTITFKTLAENNYSGWSKLGWSAIGITNNHDVSFNNVNGGQDITVSTITNNSYTVYGIYSRELTLTYNSNGGTLNTGLNTKYSKTQWVNSYNFSNTFNPTFTIIEYPIRKVDESYIINGNNSKENYECNGWYAVSNGTNIKYEPNNLIDISDNTTLNAYWNKYPIITNTDNTDYTRTMYIGQYVTESMLKYGIKVEDDYTKDIDNLVITKVEVRKGEKVVDTYTKQSTINSMKYWFVQAQNNSVDNYIVYMESTDDGLGQNSSKGEQLKTSYKYNGKIRNNTIPAIHAVSKYIKAGSEDEEIQSLLSGNNVNDIQKYIVSKVLDGQSVTDSEDSDDKLSRWWDSTADIRLNSTLAVSSIKYRGRDISYTELLREIADTETGTRTINIGLKAKDQFNADNSESASVVVLYIINPSDDIDNYVSITGNVIKYMPTNLSLDIATKVVMSIESKYRITHSLSQSINKSYDAKDKEGDTENYSDDINIISHDR